MEKLKCTFRKICDTIRNIKDNVGFYKRLWDKPQGKAAADNVKQQLIYLLKKIRPRKIEGDVVFGTGDPASTGQALGAIAMLYGVYPEKLNIVPDFDEKRFEGELHVKGRLRLIHVLIIVVRLFADKDVRYIIRKIQSKEDIKHERQ